MDKAERFNKLCQVKVALQSIIDRSKEDMCTKEFLHNIASNVIITINDLVGDAQDDLGFTFEALDQLQYKK